MSKYFWGLVVVAVAVAFIVWGLDKLTESRADLEYQRAQGRALIIEAQGQSRLDSAQAAAITSSAMLPWLIVLCVSGAVVVCVAIIMRGDGQRQPAQLVQREVYFLLERSEIISLLEGRENVNYER